MSTSQLILLYDIHYLARGGERAVRTGIGRTCLGILGALRRRDDVCIELVSSAGFEDQAEEIIRCIPECTGLPLLRFTETPAKERLSTTIRKKILHVILAQGKRLANICAPQLSRKLFARLVPLKKLSPEEIDRRQEILTQRYAGKQVWFFSIYDALPDYMLDLPWLHTAVLVHDIIPLKLPQYGASSEKFLTLLQDGAFRADHILTNTEFTRQDFFAFFPQIVADKVTTTLLGHDPQEFCPPSESEIESVRAKFGIHEGYQYIHILSSLEPRKNVLHVIACFNACVQRNELKKTMLVITGGKEWGYHSILHEAKHNKDRILFTGSVCDAEIRALLGGCSCFVFMSEYEGFGLPVVEAMACGAPVIAANATSLPEVTEDAAILVDPHDKIALESALKSVCDDAALRASLRMKSLARAKMLTWDKTATALMTTLRNAPSVCKPVMNQTDLEKQ